MTNIDTQKDLVNRIYREEGMSENYEREFSKLSQMRAALPEERFTYTSIDGDIFAPR